MTWLRWALVVAAFQTEIRVRAQMSPESLARPEGCLSAKGDCDAKVGGATLVLEKGAIAVSPGGLLQRRDGDWKLLRGTLRAKSAGVTSVYGRLEPSAEAWIVDEGRERLLVRAVEGAARFTLRDGREMEIPEGFELWIGAMNTDGRNTHGVPAPIPVEDHLHRLNAMDRPDAGQLTVRVKELKKRWKDRHETASALYEGITERRLASIEEEKQKERARREAAEARRRKERQMLYDRAFNR